MLAMTFKSGIEDPIDHVLLLKPAGELQCVFTVRSHSQAQSLEAFQENPGIKRAHGRTCGSQETENFFTNDVFGPYNRAANTTPLAVEEFGG